MKLKRKRKKMRHGLVDPVATSARVAREDFLEEVIFEQTEER